MKHSIDLSNLTLGVCYYPEHWEESLWLPDLRRMKEYGIEIIRVAEFSWSLMEREEGVFDFSFWDRFLLLAGAEGMKVIFCTPTATPPAWLTEKYPEVLNADGDGNLIYHGMRRHYNLTSPKYLELCARLVEKMGEHFNRYSCIAGWQIDNEINCEIHEYYAESDHKAFRNYLKEKYASLDELNEKMGTVFWNQTYTEWDQIHLARRSPSGVGAANPHLMLEQKRFVSFSAIRFMALQAGILRKTAGTRFITSNGIFPDIDYQELMEAGFDFICYDNYPNFAYQAGKERRTDDIKDRNSSFNLSRVRSVSPVFGIMEQQAGPGGWNFRMLQPAPKPGQMRLWTWQAIAHGADLVSYFRWRTCTKGTEIYWHGLNDYSNEDNRRLRELKQIHEEIRKVNNTGIECGIAGKPYSAKAAILTDYDNTWDGESDIWHGPLRNFSMDGWFRALEFAHIPFDFVDIRDAVKPAELFSYELVVYPHAALLNDARAAILQAYVMQGGQLIMGSRTGYKDMYGQCPMVPMPGPAGELCGVKVTDFTCIGPMDEAVYMDWDGEQVPAPVFNDILEALPGAEVKGRFVQNYYDGSPALVCKKQGEGTAWYFGAGFAEETAALFLRKTGVKSPAAELAEIPPEIEVAFRGDKMFLLNYDNAEKEIIFKEEVLEILSGEKKNGESRMDPYGVWIVEKASRIYL
ncbi:MAG: beta-galactosidase [Lacrimispora sp.]